MNPEALTQLTIPAAIALSGLALAGGAALARFSGPVACAWPAKGQAILQRLNAVKLYRRPGVIRTMAGGAALAALLAGGGWAAYAAAPSQPALALAVLTPTMAAAPTAPTPRGVAPDHPAALIAAQAAGPPSLAAQASAAPAPVAAPAFPETLSSSSNFAFLIRGDDSNYAQVRADILNKLPPAARAALPANPTLVGPLSVYAPAGVSLEGVIAQAFVDPRGTWEPGAPDAQGGRILTRTSAKVTIPAPLAYAFPETGTVVSFYRVPGSAGATFEASPTP